MTERASSAPPWPDDSVLGPCIGYPVGATVTRGGQPVRTLHFITSGVIRLTVARDGDDVFVAVRTPGWLLGAVPAILGVTHTTTGVALTDCELRPLSIAEFDHIRQANHAVGRWLQVMLAREVSEQLSRGAALVGAAGRARVEQLLVELFAAASVEREDGSRKLAFDLTVTDFANLVASGREPVSRIFTALAREAVIGRDRGWLVVPGRSPLLERIRTHSNAVLSQ
jgi:CRP-like cAMP-binding protein